MPYSFYEHTADVRMNVSGRTLEELFRDALTGMVVITDPEKKEGGAPVEKEIILEANDTTNLLVDFLSDALTLMHTEYVAYTDIIFDILNEKELKAKLIGYTTKSFAEDIKAVTHHEAEVKQNKDGVWSTNIIFDI